MTDVRLTATNPEDSSVVPVACNERGELLLEEPQEFDGNLSGDLTVSGSASFGGGVVDIEENGQILADAPIAFARPSNGQHSFNVGYSEEVFPGVTSENNRCGMWNSSGNGHVNVGLVGGASGGRFNVYSRELDEVTISFRASGAAIFAQDVVVGSRNKAWMLVESNGLCHMVEQTRASTADLVDPAVAEYPALRNVFAELDAIEKALEEVMDKLRMAPPAGWEVWDGSSENS